MKSDNGWIKYFAIAFGLVLALGIISAIVNGGIYVLQGLGLIENEFEQIGKPNASYSQDYTEKPESISISFDAGNLILQTGSQFNVEGSDLSSNLDVKMENGELVITEKGVRNLLTNLFHQNETPTLVVTVPENTKLENVDLELGAGRGEIKNIVTDDLIISQGAGAIVATHVQANSGKLKGGAGAVSFSDAILKDFDIEGGVGLIEMQGVITGAMKLDCGVGQTNLTISGNAADYFIDAEQGLGPITVNGSGISENGTGSKSAGNTIDIEGGIGPVNIVIH